MQGVSPDDAEIALVSPLDKDTFKKNEISNFRPVSILTTLWKKYKKVAKRSPNVDINKLLSPFLSA